MRTARSVLVSSVLVTSFLAIAASACNDDGADRRAPSTDDLVGKTFVSSSVEGHPMDGTTVTMSFDADGLAVHAACNTMRGSVTIAEGRLEVGPMAQTMMACADDLTAQDQFLGEFFESGPSVAMDGGTLTLSGDGATITAEAQ